MPAVAGVRSAIHMGYSPNADAPAHWAGDVAADKGKLGSLGGKAAR
jgi:hypothetical protein